MQLTLQEISALPLPCALFDKDSGLVAKTKEWKGKVPGTISFLYRGSRLVVSPEDSNEEIELLTTKLLDVLNEAKEGATPDDTNRIKMLEASIRLTSGEDPLTPGSSLELLEMTKIGISTRTSSVLKIQAGDETQINAPAVVALILVQLAANAERHEEVKKLLLTQDKKRFHLSWEGEEGMRNTKTSRIGSERERWGLGFARLAADAIGAAIYAPSGSPNGLVTATVETGMDRLALPLAKLQNDVVVKSTAGWDEETGLVVGKRLNSARLAALLVKAQKDPGEIVKDSGWTARYLNKSLWFAIPPQNTKDRARDIVRGIVHERALWESTPEPCQSQIFAYAALLDVILETPFPRMTAATWNKTMQRLERFFDLPPVPKFSGLSAIDARIVAVFADSFGDRFEVENDDLYLKIKPELADDPFIRLYLNPGDTELKLS